MLRPYLVQALLLQRSLCFPGARPRSLYKAKTVIPKHNFAVSMTYMKSMNYSPTHTFILGKIPTTTQTYLIFGHQQNASNGTIDGLALTSATLGL